MVFLKLQIICKHYIAKKFLLEPLPEVCGWDSVVWYELRQIPSIKDNLERRQAKAKRTLIYVGEVQAISLHALETATKGGGGGLILLKTLTSSLLGNDEQFPGIMS